MYMAARNAERAQEKIGELAGLELPGEVRFVCNDASEDETYVSAVETVVADEGRIDVLVNNFGTSNPSKDLDVEHTDPQEFINTVNINLKSVFITSQAALRHMVEQGAAVSSIFRRLAVPFPTSRRLGMARRRRPSTI